MESHKIQGNVFVVSRSSADSSPSLMRSPQAAVDWGRLNKNMGPGTPEDGPKADKLACAVVWAMPGLVLSGP